MKFLLRVEGVNLSNFVYDTPKLPVVRGGSAALLEAPREMPEKLESELREIGTKLEPISTGASSGLYALEVDESLQEDVGRTVRRFLRRNLYQHATFVVDIVPEDDFGHANELALAKNRWQQMQSLSLTLPEPDSRKGVSCEFDGVRPAAETVGEERDRHFISRSAAARRIKGKRSARPDFYYKITKIDPNKLPMFSEDFNDLAANPPSSVPRNLADKMAVIYLDGNKFGERARKASRTRKDLTDWDGKIQRLRADLLKTLLEEIADKGEWLNDSQLRGDEPKGKRLRFETLIWGGDDILLVAPAWKGWWLLGRFFELTKEWNDDTGNPLTHSAGLVFCHAKAHVRRVKDLAYQLCDIAKKAGDPHDRGKGDRFAYQVLESFDYVGRDLEEFLEERRPPDCSQADQVLYGSAMLSAPEHRRTLERAEMPRRKLHALVPKLRHKTAEPKDRAAIEQPPGSKEALDALSSCLGASDTRYFHLLELWDYIR
jgi:hypothetical protein